MSHDSEERRAHVLISGRVQGVSFRYATAQMAQRRQVAGWVRNLADGKVEAVFEGGKHDVESMVDWCRVGPPGAGVEHVDFAWEAPTGEFSSFNVRF